MNKLILVIAGLVFLGSFNSFAMERSEDDQNRLEEESFADNDVELPEEIKWIICNALQESCCLDVKHGDDLDEKYLWDNFYSAISEVDKTFYRLIRDDSRIEALSNEFEKIIARDLKEHQQAADAGKIEKNPLCQYLAQRRAEKCRDQLLKTCGETKPKFKSLNEFILALKNRKVLEDEKASLRQYSWNKARKLKQKEVETKKKARIIAALGTKVKSEADYHLLERGLTDAAFFNNVVAMKELLAKGADPCYSLLMCFNIKTQKAFIDEEAFKLLKDSEKKIARLKSAVGGNNFDKVKKYLNKGVHPRHGLKALKESAKKSKKIKKLLKEKQKEITKKESKKLSNLSFV